MLQGLVAIYVGLNPFPLIINDVGQKIFVIRRAYLLKGFGRVALKFLFQSITIAVKSP